MHRSNIKKFIIYWLPVIFWAGIIFYLSAVPNLNSGLETFYDVFLRKLAHVTEFAVLNFLIFRALCGYDVAFKKALVWGLIAAAFYAFSDEAHQYFVPLRQARLADVAIDNLGVLFASAIIFLVKRK